jgi:hypothetical protein
LLVFPERIRLCILHFDEGKSLTIEPLFPYSEEEPPMANITKIEAEIKTGNRDRAKTHSMVYLGIGGREFRLHSTSTDPADFDRGSVLIYVMGEPPPPNAVIHTSSGGSIKPVPVKNPEHNDPRADYVLKSEFLDKFPVYIRLDPTIDDWNLEFATARVHTPTGVVAEYRSFAGGPGSDNLWLGKDFGLYCYLLKQ